MIISFRRLFLLIVSGTLFASKIIVTLGHDNLPINEKIGVPGYPDCVQTDWEAQDKHLTLQCFQQRRNYDKVDGRSDDHNGKIITVGCIGDSITAGVHSSGGDKAYPSQLATLLGDSYAVTNLGACGSTMLQNGDSPYWQRPQFQTLIENSWDILIIMLGTNDAKDKGSGGPDNWPHNCLGSTNNNYFTKENSREMIPNLDCDFAVDYTSMIQLARTLGRYQSTEPNIFVVIPPPLMKTRSYGMNQTVINEVFPILVPAIAKNNKLINTPIDVFDALGGGNDIPVDGCTIENSSNNPTCGCKYFCNEQSCDQCHPNDMGYRKLAETVATAITNSFAKEEKKNNANIVVEMA